MSDPVEPDGDASDPPSGDVLDEVRGFLDVLDTTSAAPGLLSTTIEMAAASAGAAGRDLPPRVRTRAWWWAAAAVAAGLGGGIVVGRATSPDPDGPVLQYLPVVEHLDVLQEAGSVAFLDDVAKRGITEPRRFPFARPGGADGEGDAEEGETWPEYDDAVDALRYVTFGPETPGSELAARRDRIDDMDDDELRHVADRATAFTLLPREVRYDLIVLARALGESEDDRLEHLSGAARIWHRWVAWSDPADRQALVALGREERLEWLERRTRGPGRGQWPGGRGFPGGRGPQGGDGPRSGARVSPPPAESPGTPPATS